MTCSMTPGCGFQAHAAGDHPCGTPIRVGDPCLYCSVPIAADADGQPVPCPDCWHPATIADIKALAAEAGLNVTLRSGGPYGAPNA